MAEGTPGFNFLKDMKWAIAGNMQYRLGFFMGYFIGLHYFVGQISHFEDVIPVVKPDSDDGELLQKESKMKFWSLVDCITSTLIHQWNLKAGLSTKTNLSAMKNSSAMLSLILLFQEVF